MGPKGWPQMQCDNPRANEWGKPNLMHIVEEKMTKAKWEKKIISREDHQVLVLDPTQDLKSA